MPDNELHASDALENWEEGPQLLVGDEDTTETIDLDKIFTQDLSVTGSFDIRGGIWATAFGMLLQSLPIPAMLLDSNHTIVAANQACEKLGSGEDELVDTLFYDLIPDSLASKKAQELLSEVFQTRKPRVAEGILLCGERKTWGRLSLRSVRIMYTRMILVLVADLTRKKAQLAVNRMHNKRLEREIARRAHMETELRKSEANYRELFENASDIVFTHDLRGNFRSVNEAVTRVLGYERSEFLNLILANIVVGDSRRTADQVCAELSRGIDHMSSYELLVQTKSQGPVWIGVSSRAMRRNEVCVGVHSIAREINDVKLAEEVLRESERRFRELADLLPQPLLEIDRRGYVTFINRNASATLGILQEEPSAGMGVMRLISPDDRAKLRRMFSLLLSGQEVPQGQEFTVRRKDGSTFPALIYCQPIVRMHTLSGVIAVAWDITERARADAEREKLIAELTQARDSLHHKATHDELSGVLSRGAILEIFHKELARARRERQPVGIIIADIDQFKRVNDEYGHLTGDAALRGVAQRIAMLMREYDSVGRYGGDEFLIILPGCDVEDAKQTAERISESLNRDPVSTNEGAITVTMSFGVAATNGKDVSDADSLIRLSDEALYRAKNLGRNRVEAPAT